MQKRRTVGQEPCIASKLQGILELIAGLGKRAPQRRRCVEGWAPSVLVEVEQVVECCVRGYHNVNVCVNANANANVNVDVNVYVCVRANLLFVTWCVPLGSASATAIASTSASSGDSYC